MIPRIERSEKKFSPIQRHIKKLLEEGIVETAYLARNRRDRTLHYTIDYEKLNQVAEAYMEKRRIICKRNLAVRNRAALNHSVCIHMAKITDYADKNEHMVDHMIYIENNNKIYKSHKSKDDISRDGISRDAVSGSVASGKISVSKAQEKSLQKRNEEMVREVIAEQIPKEKPHIIQDMVKSLENIFPGLIKTVRSRKAICRNLVAAFQRKFHNSIEEWERYLKLIETSPYLNGEKFKLSIHWILKFFTIDRILNGEFGVSPDKITYTKKEQGKMAEDRKQQIQQKIDDINETEICKQARIGVLDMLGVDDYQKYFENPNKCRFIERDNGITIEILGTEPWNFTSIAQKLEQMGVETKWVSDCIKVTDEKGHEFFGNAKSFEELERMNTSKLQKEENSQNEQQNDECELTSPLLKRIFKVNEPENTVTETQTGYISNTPENSCFNFSY